MELRFDKVRHSLAGLEEAVSWYMECKDDLALLRDYMASGLWRKDFEADEAGKVPADLKRGVLSEDGLYDLLQDADRILKKAEEVLCAQ